MSFRRISWFFFLFPLVLFGDVQNFDIELSVEKPKVALGEAFTLNASFKQPEGYQADIPALIEQLLWTANSSSPRFVLRQTLVSADKKKLELVLEPLMLGMQYLTFLDVAFKGEKTVNVTSSIVQLEVEPAKPVEKLSLAPLHSLVPELPLGMTQTNRQIMMEDRETLAVEAQRNVRIISKHSFPWLTLFLIAFFIAAWFSIKRFIYHLEQQKRAKLEATSARIQAEQALQALKDQQLIEQRKYKEYFFTLTDIVWAYLEGRYKLLWRHFTTDELAQFQATNTADSSLKDKLVVLLNIADQVKFAGHIPTHAEYEQALSRAEEIIHA